MKEAICDLLQDSIPLAQLTLILQPDSPTKCIDNPTFRVNSPSKPILAVFSPTNGWSYSTVGLSIRW